MQQEKCILHENNYFSPSLFSRDGHSTVIFTLLLAFDALAKTLAISTTKTSVRKIRHS